MKGILLVGGSGTRLYPMTQSVNKHLLPIYDKPMIYYPLSILMLANIREILIISTPKDLPLYQNLLGDGKQLGMSFSYAVQKDPKGIAEVFLIGEKFISHDSIALVLGDNFFYGHDLPNQLQKVNKDNQGATIFGYYVEDPKSYGVLVFDEYGKVCSIEEKPKEPKSNYAVPGLYFYDSEVVNIAKSLSPSSRGELEITDVNRSYLQKGKLQVELLDKDFIWLDMGTPDALLEASNFLQAFQKDKGRYIACIEEIAYRKGYITKEQLSILAKNLKNTRYGKYLTSIM
ncbi:MAG: glucose-1-phosphate thymidylyltransferase RfbA [Epulopiscium sp.]|nr:glucose-1-phosphate thymidylyltransferase RfbA [Candidatus Epulonipiscium sp.]